MGMRIRQFVFAADDLDQTEAEVSAVLGADVCYRDPEVAHFGLKNALYPVGDQFVEIVTPTEDDTAAGRHMERHGRSGYMLILQTDDFAADRARLERLGVRTVWEADRDDIRAAHIHPKDIGGTIVSIDQPAISADWPWAGENWRSAAERGAARQIRAVTVGAVDPHVMARRWAEVLGLEAVIDDADHATIHIDEGRLHFVKADRDVLTGMEVAVTDVKARLAAATKAKLLAGGDEIVVLCGVNVKLVEV